MWQTYFILLIRENLNKDFIYFYLEYCKFINQLKVRKFMKHPLVTATGLIFIFLSVVFSCKNSKQKSKEKSNNLNARMIRKDSTIKDQVFQKAPIINLENSKLTKQYIIYVKDSANQSRNLNIKMKNNFEVEIPKIIKKLKLEKIGSPITWFLNEEAPFYFENGLEVSKKPPVLPKPYKLRIIEPSKAIIAHYYGPYSNTVLAYDVLNDWIKTNGKKKKHGPYEVYIDSPFDSLGNAKDPYKVQTDIIYLYQ